MTTFLESLDAEIEAVEREQAAIARRREELEDQREKLLDVRVIYNGDGPAPPPADPPPVAKPKPSAPPKPKPAVAPKTKPKVTSKLLGRSDIEADVLRSITAAGEPIARSKVIEGMQLKVTYSVVGDALDALVENGEVEKTGVRAGTRYGVPSRTVHAQQPTRPPVIPSSSAQRPTPNDRANGADYRVKIREIIKAHGPISPAEVRERTNIGQGGLVQAIAKLKQLGEVETQGAGRGTKYVYVAEADRSHSPADGKPAPLPPPERTALQDRIVQMIGAKPLTTTEIWQELEENPLRVEGSVSALQKRDEIVQRDGMWFLA